MPVILNLKIEVGFDVSDKKKVKLNPDKQLVEVIREGLKQRDGHCPCLVDKTEDTKCPCKVFRETKDCHCGLYITEDQGKEK